MSCGGNMMRSSQQPLARLVDAAAARWLDADQLTPDARDSLRRDIIARFPLGNLPRITLHGRDYTLTLEAADEPVVSAHQIEKET